MPASLPPSSTPPGVGNPVHLPQVPPQPQVAVQQQQQQPPMHSNTSTLTRQRANRIKITDPNSGAEVSLDDMTKPSAQPPSQAPTPGPTDTANPSLNSSSEQLPDPDAIKRAEFAAKVAAVAPGSGKRVDKSETPTDIVVGELTQEVVEDPPLLKPDDIVDVSPTSTPYTLPERPEENSFIAPPPATTLAPAEATAPVTDDQLLQSSTSDESKSSEDSTLSERVPKSPNNEDATSLSVNCPELRPGEEPLYEPVSPTPLPDSPCDEKKSTTADSNVVSKPSPFEEVINKKANGTVSGIEKVPTQAATETDESGFEPANKPRKKKQSAASRKAALNSKPEKKGDLLDVFKVDNTSNDQIPAVTKKSPTPEPATVNAEIETPPVLEDPVATLTNSLGAVQISPKEETPVAEVEEVKPVEETDVAPKPENTVREPVEERIVENVIPAEKHVENKMNGILDAIPPELRRGESMKTDSEVEIEDGEIISDEETEGVDGEAPKLKYNYKDDQWSPLNPEGKKQYDREFLICLQSDPLSMEKPTNLPNMEIVKDKPNMGPGGKGIGLPNPAKFDFTPGFVVKSNSRGPMSKRGSQGGDRKGGERRDQQQGQKPRMVISLPSISQEVKLNKAKNAWVPGVKKKDEGGDDVEVLKKQVLSILNKLTPQKFETLVEKFQDLPIDSQDKLSACMELVFEKAVDEPSFSVAYAQMCKVMQMKKVPVEGGKDDEFVNFRKLLISRCQKEFEKDYMADLDRSKYDKELAEAGEDQNEIKRIKAEFEYNEMKLRRRSLGNIRFIGELYKLGMLTARIMHECVKKLLCSPSDEEALECLCRLLTTVGKDLDMETRAKISEAQKNPSKASSVAGINDLSVYFKEMTKLVNDRKTSSRVRFLLQDVIDLKQNEWKKRREEAGPKTIDQIHKEIETEQLQQKLQHMVPSGPPPPRRDDRRDSRMDDGRKRSQRLERDRGQGGGGHQQGQGEDGWQAVPTRVGRPQFEKVDTRKLIQTAQSKVDADNLSFGPPRMGPMGGGLGAGGWSRGSQSKGQTPREDTKMQNRFAGLDQGESGHHAYEGRSSGGRFGRQDSVGRQPGGYMGRNSSSRGGSTEPQHQQSGPGDRQRAIQAARDFVPRSQSVMVTSAPSGNLGGSHNREGSAPRSASMVGGQSKSSNVVQPPEIPLNGKDAPSMDEVKKWTEPLINEFIHNYDVAEALKEVGEKFSQKSVGMFAEEVLNSVLERSEQARSRSGELMAQLLTKRMLRTEQLLSSLHSILEFAEDLLVDIPKFWDFLAQLISPIFVAEAASLTILKDSADKAGLCSGDMGVKCAGGKYVAAVLHQMARQMGGSAPVSRLWLSTGLSWESFLGSNTDKQEFLTSNKLEWTQVEGSGANAGKPNIVQQLSEQQIAHDLSRILAQNRDSNDKVSQWLEMHLNERLKSPLTLRGVFGVIAESCIDGIEAGHCTLNVHQLKLRSSILKKYIDGKLDMELQALLALQFLMHRLEHPNKLLHTFFENMYENDVISDEGFIAWEKNDAPGEQEGKGVALKSTTQFLIWVKEAEEDD